MGAFPTGESGAPAAPRSASSQQKVGLPVVVAEAVSVNGVLIGIANPPLPASATGTTTPVEVVTGQPLPDPVVE